MLRLNRADESKHKGERCENHHSNLGHDLEVDPDDGSLVLPKVVNVFLDLGLGCTRMVFDPIELDET